MCFVVLVASACPTCAHGQEYPLDRVNYPERLREDLEVLRTTIHQVHPDPYRYVDHQILDAMFDSVSAGLDVPLTIEAFADRIRPLVSTIGDANTRMEMPQAWVDHLDSKALLIPIKVHILESGDVYIEEELKGFRSIPPGSLVISINGRPLADILTLMGKAIPSDGRDEGFPRRMMERDFKELYHLMVERSARFQVEYVRPDGEPGEQVLMGMTRSEIALSHKDLRTGASLWHTLMYPDGEVAWVTLRTLDKDALQAAGIRPEQFLKALLKDLRREQVSTMVLDLRGADGHDLGMAEMVYGVIAQEPYRVVREMSVRSTSFPDHYRYALPEEAYYASVSGRYLPDQDGSFLLRPEDPLLSELMPSGKVFSGRVYIVVDGATRSAAAGLAIMAKRSGRARIVGGATGTNALGFCGGRELVLTVPNTGLVFHVPLHRYVFEGTPEGPTDLGEQPHHRVEQQPWGIAKGRDTVQEALLMMIRER